MITARFGKMRHCHRYKDAAKRTVRVGEPDGLKGDSGTRGFWLTVAEAEALLASLGAAIRRAKEAAAKESLLSATFPDTFPGAATA
jgi:hypothetical protein